MGTEEAKQAEARKAQVAKADRARQQSKDNKAKLEAAFDKGAQHYGRMLKDDDREKEVKIRAMRNMIKNLFENGSKETARDIAAGDFDKVFNHLRSINDLDKKAYMKEKRAEARKKSVAMNKEVYGKDMKSKDPKVAAKAKADAKYYVDRDAERAKIAAGREHDEAFSIVRALNNA